MTAEVPKGIQESLGDLNLDPTPPLTERVLSAVVPIDAIVHVAGFLNQQTIPLVSDFARHEIEMENVRILNLALKMSDLSDLYQSMPTATMQATRSELLLLREIKRHVLHLPISQRETELFERSYRDIIRPFKNEFKKNRAHSNSRIWLEILNTFNRLNSK